MSETGDEDRQESIAESHPWLVALGAISCLLGAILPWVTPPPGVIFTGPHADMTGMDMQTLASPWFSGTMTAGLAVLASVLAIATRWDRRLGVGIAASGALIVAIAASYPIAPSIPFSGGTADPLLAKSGGIGLGLVLTGLGGALIFTGGVSVVRADQS